jgi:hypothetical protein
MKTMRIIFLSTTFLIVLFGWAIATGEINPAVHEPPVNIGIYTLGVALILTWLLSVVIMKIDSSFPKS